MSLRAQANADRAGWRDLIVTRGGRDLRVLSPNLAALSPGRTGSLDGYLEPSNDVMGNLTARIRAALNRGTLLAKARQPDATAAGFYRVPVTNHDARLVHSADRSQGVDRGVGHGGARGARTLDLTDYESAALTG